jgi:hypothetical protein
MVEVTIIPRRPLPIHGHFRQDQDRLENLIERRQSFR